MSTAQLEILRKRVHSAAGPDRQMDAALWLTAFPAQRMDWGAFTGPWVQSDDGYHPVATITTSVDAVVEFISRVLPGWWWTCGLCALTGHASIGPDYNGPDRERLVTEWPPEIYDHGQFNADLPPGDGIHRVCYALLDCMLQALIAKAAGIPVREG